LGKYVKSTFHPGRDSRFGAVLERVHSDVCGPFSIASIEKHMYYVVFVDDISRKCCFFFMRKKDDFFSNVVEFKALLKRRLVRN